MNKVQQYLPDSKLNLVCHGKLWGNIKICDKKMFRDIFNNYQSSLEQQFLRVHIPT